MHNVINRPSIPAEGCPSDTPTASATRWHAAAAILAGIVAQGLLQHCPRDSLRFFDDNMADLRGICCYFVVILRDTARPPGHASSPRLTGTDYGTEADVLAEKVMAAKPGDLVAHNSAMLHRAGPNQSEDRQRRAIGFICKDPNTVRRFPAGEGPRAVVVSLLAGE